MKRSKQNKGWKSFLRLFSLHQHSVPLLVTCLILSVLLVLFRMKGVEQGYAHAKLKKRLYQVKVVDKELRAKRANLLSIENLRKYAQKFDLTPPKEQQILVIPDRGQ